jgi:hypothetical protein
MNIEKTERGFDIIEFLDRYGNGCSLQKSSLATEDCIWLGVNESRMHLTQGQVKALLPYLQRFVDTGELGAVETQGEYATELIKQLQGGNGGKRGRMRFHNGCSAGRGYWYWEDGL